MRDLIDRQAAIDALAEWHDVAITNRLNNLPSAQPDVPDTNVGDMISRQAAIALFEKYGAEDDAVALLESLPSAKPGWIPCSPETMPKSEEKVLITCEYLDIYGKPHRYVCKAFHVDRYTMRADVDWWDEGCDEYREEDDQYYVLEGWYEYIHNWGDYSSVRITEDKVVAWMLLPTPYREGGQDGKN